MVFRSWYQNNSRNLWDEISSISFCGKKIDYVSGKTMRFFPIVLWDTSIYRFFLYNHLFLNHRSTDVTCFRANKANCIIQKLMKYKLTQSQNVILLPKRTQVQHLYYFNSTHRFLVFLMYKVSEVSIYRKVRYFYLYINIEW